MKWYDDLTSCNAMFRDLSNIISIDLTKFDAPQVVDMIFIFFGCDSLETIQIENFNTEKLEDMGFMF